MSKMHMTALRLDRFQRSMRHAEYKGVGWENYAARNTLVLRNTSVGNFFDLCGISLPLKAKLPVGLMLMARNGHDRMLLRIAAAVEKALAS